MEIWQLALIVGSLAASTAAFIWMALRSGSSAGGQQGGQDSYPEVAEREVEHLFSETFREELRNRGRLHFEKIIGENAMFLQQDLRLTTSQLNDFLKDEITKKLKQEFVKYEESIIDAKEMAVEALNKTQNAIEQQYKSMSQQLADEMAQEKARMTKHFEENMADIVNHYVLAAVGDQIDLTDQLEFIISGLEEHKAAIIRDISEGA